MFIGVVVVYHIAIIILHCSLKFYPAFRPETSFDITSPYVSAGKRMGGVRSNLLPSTRHPACADQYKKEKKETLSRVRFLLGQQQLLHLRTTESCNLRRACIGQVLFAPTVFDQSEM